VTWYYSDNGRQVGPIEESALDDLYRSGVVRNETPVWREGMANWQPYASVRPVQPIATPIPPVPGAPLFRLAAHTSNLLPSSRDLPDPSPDSTQSGPTA
jgi:hypothetical protein